jgi:cytochrome c5
MKTKSWFGVGVFVLMAVLNSCYYDHFDALYPSVVIVDACDTARAYTYSASIKYIMAESCISCHNSSVQNGNINLDNYDGVVSQIANGKLVGSIDRASGFKAMPPTTSLRSCEIDKIKQWINNGYKK